MSTAALSLLTGLPGSGKSLRFVREILDAQKAGELVYWCNINGLNIPGVIHWENPREWEQLPAGSVLFVDEAQDFFPMRRSGDPAPYVKMMNKLRHFGIRLVLGTQKPGYLDTHVRGLVGRHEHLLRLDGKAASTLFMRNTVFDTESSKLLKASDTDRETWNFDPELYPLYKSAEVHTIKYKMPRRVRKGILFVACFLVLVAALYFILHHNIASAHGPIDSAGNMPATTSPVVAGATKDKPKYANPQAYLDAHTPRFAGKPWSAPVYDGRAVAADPMLLCAISGTGRHSTCHCYTEQATPYDMALTDQQCRMFARDGIYNPYHVASIPAQAQQPAPAPSDEYQGENRTLPAGGGIPFGTLAHYGAIHTETGSSSRSR